MNYSELGQNIGIPRQFKEVFDLINELRSLMKQDSQETISVALVGEWFEKTNDKVWALFDGDLDRNAPEEINMAMFDLEPDIDSESIILRNHKVVSLAQHPKVIDKHVFEERLIDRALNAPMRNLYSSNPMDKSQIERNLHILEQGLMDIIYLRNDLL